MRQYSALDHDVGASSPSPVEATFSDHRDHSYNEPSKYASDSTTDSISKSKRPRIRNSVGVARLYILSLSAVALAAATTILALLWAGAAIATSEDDPGQVWKDVVSRGWAPITVTLCAAAIRTAVSLQAGVAMSMIAAVVIEQYPHRVRLDDSAFLSIVRAISIQPANMFFSRGRGILKSLGFVGSFLVAVMSITMLASAFTSSVLLSDFGNIVILGPSSKGVMGYGGDSAASNVDVWRSNPVQYPRFAELTKSFGNRLVGDHLDDTGFVLRAPVPMTKSDQRQTLRKYEGPAVVFDDRVICVAPRNITLQSLNKTSGDRGWTFTGFLAIQGVATFDSNDDMPSPLHGTRGGRNATFFCHLLDTDPHFGHLSSGVNITVCTVPFGFPTTSDGDQHPLWLKPAHFRPGDFNPSTPVFFLLELKPAPGKQIKFANFINNAYKSDGPGGYDISPDELVRTREGPWHRTKLQNIAGLEGVTISITTCAANNIGIPYNVVMTSPSDGPEPTFGWQGELETVITSFNARPSDRYDTTAVRRQLAATANSTDLTSQQRGIMDLTLNTTTPLYNNIYQFNLEADGLFPMIPLVNCPGSIKDCRTDPSAIMSTAPSDDLGHPSHVSLFTEVLADTKSPARALQAWLNVMTRQKFYDSLGRFLAGGEAEFATSVEVFAPQRWGGFIGVVAVMLWHLLAVAWVVLWFLRVTTHTMLGNSWQAVAQVVSEETLPLLLRADDLKDSEVRVIIQGEMGGVGRCGVMRSRKPGGERRRVLVVSSP